jgi:hypothetical protein
MNDEQYNQLRRDIKVAIRNINIIVCVGFAVLFFNMDFTGSGWIFVAIAAYESWTA